MLVSLMGRVFGLYPRGPRGPRGPKGPKERVPALGRGRWALGMRRPRLLVRHARQLGAWPLRGSAPFTDEVNREYRRVIWEGRLGGSIGRVD